VTIQINTDDFVFGTTVFTGAVIRYGIVHYVSSTSNQLALVQVKEGDLDTMKMTLDECTFSSRALYR